MLDVTNGGILGGESEAAIHVSSAVWIAKIYGYGLLLYVW